MNKNSLVLKYVAAFSVLATAFFFVRAIAHAQVVSGPTIPPALTASVNQSNQVYVSWGPSTATTTQVIGYYLYRNGRFIANTPGYTFYTDSVPAGAYSYTVAAYDNTGAISPQSPTTPIVTVLPDNQAPTAPTNLVAQVSSSSVNLSWSPSTDNFAVIGYYVYRNGQKFNTATPISGTSYLDSGLPEGTSYTYTVVAYDAVGNVSDQATPVTVKTLFDVQAPTAPQGLTAKAISSNEIDLSWQPSTDNVGVTSYIIWQNGSPIATITGTSTTYANTGLSPGTAYTYYVYATDAVGNISIQGPGASAVTLPPDLTPPSIPTNFYATALSSSQVQLTWSPSTDNTAVAGYYLYNGSNQIATVASTTYIDTNLATSTTYQYFLAAYDASGNVSPKASLAVTTLSYTPSVVATTTSVDTTTTPTNPVLPTDTTTSPVTTPASSGTSSLHLTANLYYGSRGANVQALQQFLIQQGQLNPIYGTGFYGLLTQKAVKAFQCAKGIICSGGPYTTGWGSVGPRTRAILNTL